MLRPWLSPSTRRAPASPRTPTCRPHLECLEDRSLPSASGTTAAAALAVPPPASPSTVTGITLQVPNLFGEPTTGLTVNSVHGGETLSATGNAQFDALQVTLPLQRGLPALAWSYFFGTSFSGVQLNVTTGNKAPYVTFEANDVKVSAIHLSGTTLANLKVEVDLTFSQLTTTGPAANASFPVPASWANPASILLSMQGFQTTSPDGLHLASVHLGETFSTGQTPQLDPFQAVLASSVPVPPAATTTNNNTTTNTTTNTQALVDGLPANNGTTTSTTNPITNATGTQTTTGTTAPTATPLLSDVLSLEDALTKGTVFTTGALTLKAADGTTSQTFNLNNVMVSSLQLVGGPAGLPQVMFTFTAGLTPW